MVDDSNDNGPAVFPSVDDCVPDEQGGPIARSGFTYQDYVAARFFMQMIVDSTIVKVHCETQDDIVVIRATPQKEKLEAEFVQVKTSSQDSNWSAAKLCNQKNDNPNTSIFEKSLLKDRVHEAACFRIVTSQDVMKALKPLTLDKAHGDRALSSNALLELKTDIDKRCPGAESDRGNDSTYWLANVIWDVQGPQRIVEELLRLDVLMLSIHEDRTLLPEQADKVIVKLLHWVRKAADAHWTPDKAKKIITRSQVVSWWNTTLDEELASPSTISGGKLSKKLKRASVSDPTISLANELRRDYAAELRSPQYMQDIDQVRIPRVVRSRLLSLRAAYESGELAMTSSQFHTHCVQEIDQLGVSEEGDQAAFAKGCMYDMTDRCLMTYDRESS